MITVITYLSLFSPLIPLALGYKRHKHLLWGYLLFSMVFDVSLTYVIRPLDLNRFIFINLYVITEWVLVCLYIKSHLQQKAKQPVLYFIILITAAYLLQMAFTSFGVFNGMGMSVISILGVALAMFGLYSMLENREVVQLETSGYFWANVAFIVYFAGNFVLFLFTNYLEETDMKALRYLWPIVHNTLNVIYRLLLAVALTRKTV